MVKFHAWQNKEKSFSFLSENAAKNFFLKFIKNGDSILDIGCGDCRFFDFVKEHKNCEFHAFDINKTALKIAKNKGYLVRNSLDIDKQFDIISMVEVFEHLTMEERIIMAQRIDKLLKPQGYLLMTFPHIKSFLSVANYFDNLEHKAPYVKEDGVLSIFEGYELISKKYFEPWLNPLKILLCILTGLDLNAIYNHVGLILQKPTLSPEKIS